MNNPELHTFLVKYALNLQDVATLLEIDRKTVSRWQHKKALTKRNRLALSALSQELEEVQS